MRIVWITTQYYPKLGGIQTYVAAVLRELRRRHDVALVVNTGQTHRPDEPSVETFALPLASPVSSEQWHWCKRELSRYIYNFRPEIVHFASAGLAVYLDCVPKYVSTVITVHGKDLTDPWQVIPGVPEPRTVLNSALKNCSAIVAVSETTASFVRACTNCASLRVIGHGCSLDRFVTEKWADDGTPTLGVVTKELPIVLTVGRLVPRKGHLNLLSGLAKIPSDFRWVIVGDGPSRSEIESGIAASQLRERAILLGEVSEKQLGDLYRKCTIFALTPIIIEKRGRVDFEGFGLVYHEAGAFGKAAVGSLCSGSGEAVINGRTGLLVQPDNAESVAGAVTTLLTDSALRERLGRTAREHVHSLGGWTRVTAELDNLYATLRS